MKFKQKLIEHLNELVVLFPRDNRHLIIRALEGPAWINDKKGIECLELIRKIPELEMFNDKMQPLGKVAARVSHKKLLDWLLIRTMEGSAEEAIISLIDYFSNKTAEVELIELLTGVYSDLNYEFCNGVIFSKIHELNNSNLSSSLQRETLLFTPIPTVSSILSIKFDHPIKHYSSDEKNKNLDFMIPNQEIEDAKLCLSLATSVKIGIFSISSTVSAPDNIPFLYEGHIWDIRTFKLPSLSPQIIKLEFENADKILKNFLNLDEDFKNKLRIPLKRINDFGANQSLVDSAIDLRICLESIFLEDNNKEQLRYRLALRAARFIGKTIEEKSEILKFIKETYDITSTAVHNGKFSKKAKTDKLFRAADFARLAIIKLINEGKVNWNELELN